MSHDETAHRLAADQNRTILRNVVGYVRAHLAAHHAGDADVDCTGAIRTLEEATVFQLATLLEAALCRLARQPDDGPEAQTLAALDFIPGEVVP